MIRRILLPAYGAVLLSGCVASDQGRFPSLAPRAAEREGFEEPAAPPPRIAAADPALDTRIAQLAAESVRRREGFDTARAAAGATVAAARGAPAGSSAWLDAQVALGSLDVIRAEGSQAMTALEQLATDRAIAGDPPYPALDAAVAKARARMDEITHTIAELGARLNR